MGTGDLKVEFGAVDTGAASLMAQAGKLEQRLLDLEAELKPMKSDWIGGASEQYDASQREWTAAMTDLKLLLSQIGGGVRDAGDGFKTTEATNTAMFT